MYISDLPAIFTTNDSSPTTGKRYEHINTSLVIETFVKNGFTLDQVSPARSEFGKHGFKLLHPDLPDSPQGKFQIVGRTSHDGRSSLQLYVGFYRFACANGLILGTTEDAVRIPHRGHIDNILDGVFQVIDRAKSTADTVQAMQQRLMVIDEIEEFQFKAIELRDVPKHQLFLPHRTEDAMPTLWNQYNMLQEALMNGMYYNSNNRRARAIKAFNSQVELNKKIFAIAKDYI